MPLKKWRNAPEKPTAQWGKAPEKSQPAGAAPVQKLADGVGQLLAAQAAVVGDDLLDEPKLGDTEGSVLELDAFVAVRAPHLDATVRRRTRNVQRLLITSRLDPVNRYIEL